MKRIVTSIALLALLLGAAAAVVGVTRLRRPGPAALPTSVVGRTTFVDYLQLRGEIRPVKSTMLSAPMSGGSDLQIIQLAKNGSVVNAGDVVVQFDTTVQQRTLEQKQSELKQADAEIDRVLAEQRRREQTAQTALVQARSALDRARLYVETSELRPRVEIEKLKITAANAEDTVRELEQKVAAVKASAAADVASARQKRD